MGNRVQVNFSGYISLDRTQYFGGNRSNLVNCEIPWVQFNECLDSIKCIWPYFHIWPGIRASGKIWLHLWIWEYNWEEDKYDSHWRSPRYCESSISSCSYPALHRALPISENLIVTPSVVVLYMSCYEHRLSAGTICECCTIHLVWCFKGDWNVLNSSSWSPYYRHRVLWPWHHWHTFLTADWQAVPTLAASWWPQHPCSPLDQENCYRTLLFWS